MSFCTTQDLLRLRDQELAALRAEEQRRIEQASASNMTIADYLRFNPALTANRQINHQKAVSIHAYDMGSISVKLLTKSSAKLVLQEALKAALEHRQGNKINRPWHIVDVTEKLDPEQAWYGFEFEGGYATEANYKKVIKYFWSRFPYSAIDTEGVGRWSAELTFSPCNESDLDGDFGLMKLVKYINRNKIGMANWSVHDSVGTHVNISTPTFRALPYERAAQVANTITNMLQGIGSSDQYTELFGRQPYGWCYIQNAGNGKQWIEFKLFNSTTDEAALRQYAQVAKRLAKLMDAVASLPEANIAAAEQTVAWQATDSHWRQQPQFRHAYMDTRPAGYTGVYEFLRGDSDELTAAPGFYVPEHFTYNSDPDVRARGLEESARVARAAVAAYRAALATPAPVAA